MLGFIAVFLLAWFLSPGYSNATQLCPISGQSSSDIQLADSTQKNGGSLFNDLMYKDEKKPVMDEKDYLRATGLYNEPYIPIRYKIFLSPNISSAQTYGTIELDFSCEIDSAVLEFDIAAGEMLISNSENVNSDISDENSKENGPKSDRIILEDVSENTPTEVKIKETGYLPDYANRTKFYIIPERTVKGRKYRIHLPFNGRLNDQLQGFYKAGYQDINGKQKYLAATQFSPTDARKAFPCLDRPSLKATFEISIERPNDMRTLSNMPVSRSEYSESKPGHTIDYFPETVKMSTYLVAFIVSDLIGSVKSMVPVPNSPNGKTFPLRTWSRPEVLDQTEYARNLSVTLLEYFQKYFSIDFPLNKIDLVAVPEFGFNAMENWGLITFRESAMLISPEATPEHAKESSSLVISHELAHQWFGNLVSPCWWNDLWLKEGFATYVEYLGVDYAEPSWRMLDKFLTSTVQPTLDHDSTMTSHAISMPVSTDAEIRRMFDAVSYSKGASIIRMMEHFIGHDLFTESLKKYLLKYQYACARQDQLFDELTNSANEAIKSGQNILPQDTTVKEIMDSWTLKAGYPVLNVERNYDTGNITFSQSKFMLPNPAASSGPGSELSYWWIPVSIQTSDQSEERNTKPRIWLTPKDGDSVTLNMNELKSNEWLLANVNQTGFYRVNYDHQNWLLLIDSYYDLDEATRSQLLDDSFALARAERLEYEIPLILVSRLSHDHSAIPWHAAGRQILALVTMMSREPAYGSFRAYMLMAVNGVYHTLGFDASSAHAQPSATSHTHPATSQIDAEETHVRKMHRALMVRLACVLDHPDCLNRAQYALRLWMRDETRNPIAPDLRAAVYCAGLKQGNVEEWDFLFKMYKSSDVPSEKDILLSAMGCSRDPWILARYLEMTLQPDSPFSKQDGARIFEAVASNKHGFDLATAHLIDNFKRVYEYYGEGFSTVKKMIHALALYMNKESDKKKLASFAKELDTLGIESAKKHLQFATESILNNIYWRSHRYDNLEKWVTEFNTKFHIA